MSYDGSSATGHANETNSAINVATTVITDILLFFLVFGMSATVDIKSMRHQMRNYKALGCGVFLQFVVLPFLGFLTVRLFNIDEVSGITLLVIVSSPGGSYSNWWCSLFNAELALSIAMTTISTLLSIAFLPFNLYIYSLAAYRQSDAVQNINFLSLLVSIFIVIGAVTLGLICSAKVKYPKFHKFANFGGNISGIMLIIFSGVIALFGGGDSTENDPIMDNKSMYWSTGLPCILGLLLANVITSAVRLEKPERVTCSVECCYQNTGIATAVAISMFNGQDLSEAVKVPLWYGIVEAVVLGIYLIIAWKIGYTKAPPNEKFWTVISTSYEVQNNDHNSQQSDEDDQCEEEIDSKKTDKESSDVEIVQHNQENCDDDVQNKNDTIVDNEESVAIEIAHEKSKDEVEMSLSTI